VNKSEEMREDEHRHRAHTKNVEAFVAQRCTIESLEDEGERYSLDTKKLKIMQQTAKLKDELKAYDP